MLHCLKLLSQRHETISMVRKHRKSWGKMLYHLSPLTTPVMDDRGQMTYEGMQHMLNKNKQKPHVILARPATMKSTQLNEISAKRQKSESEPNN